MLYKKAAIAGLTIAMLGLLPAASASALAAETSPRVDASGDNMQPPYPASALANRESGAVVISTLVRADGTVKRVRLQQSSGYADLDTAAANAVKSWKFIPGTEDGQPEDAWTNIQIVFSPPN
jgi:periplasmic protein TonB